MISFVIVALRTILKGLERRLNKLEIGGRIDNNQTTTLLISQNTKKSHGDPRRLTVTQTPGSEELARSEAIII